MASYNTHNKNFEYSDDYTTPMYVWDMLSLYIPKETKLWDPFYNEGVSKKRIESLGYKVYHKKKDFFTYQPKKYDMVLSNPPYSIKQEVLKKLKENDKPFILILPIGVLSTKYFKSLFDSKDITLFLFPKRINFERKDIITSRSSICTVGIGWKIKSPKQIIYL